ncbi:hypothetical protein LEP1GSC052_0886 [Leptospira kmetyi serovar Malaysia str. Bejo-Iso9]|nr:hypothetical protein LEP1GSC052_0886 [Leptospira kmetyi serovar Malaysia str. Bejo-Iso9]
MNVFKKGKTRTEFLCSGTGEFFSALRGENRSLGFSQEIESIVRIL